LLVSRTLVLHDRVYPVLRVELAGTQPRIDPEQWPDPQEPPVQELSADDLMHLVRECGVEGVLFAARRSAIGRSRLPGLLRRLRPQYSGWLGLETIGPEPADLRAVLREPLLNFVDVQLAWLETDPHTRDAAVLVNPGLRQIVSILLKTPCPCVVRFTRPAEDDVFNQVSSAFDAFVRVSPEPVAVQVVEPDECESAPRSCAVGSMEFIACRPAWLVRQSQGQWYQVQPRGQNLPQAIGREVGSPRRGRRF
jgi:hypothetical protein